MSSSIVTRPAFGYFSADDTWKEAHPPGSINSSNLVPGHLVVSSYNVRAGLQTGRFPPGDRSHLVVKTLLGINAAADILVLQEVTDSLLAYLLGDRSLQDRYPYASHSASTQANCASLPYHLNSVVLSKHFFTCEHLPSTDLHGVTYLAVFDDVGLRRSPSGRERVVLAVVHLTRGVADDSVTAKYNEMQRLTRHLSAQHFQSAWIIAGAFNMISSSQSIAALCQERLISGGTLKTMRFFERLLFESGLRDTWTVSRLELGESSDDIRQGRVIGPVYEGEQGATFDPLHNHLASQTAKGEATERPQRYDRILLGGVDAFYPAGFNIFGDGRTATAEPSPLMQGSPPASDHYGIRCLLQTRGTGTREDSLSNPHMVPVHARSAMGTLARPLAIRDYLVTESIIPTVEDEETRARAFAPLVDAILNRGPEAPEKPSSGIPLVVTPVGSYGLGVWTTRSDIDCLCIGAMSSRIFFQIAKQRLRKASAVGIRVLRTVNAASGKMLEVEIQGAKVDLHYCQAPTIALMWPDVVKRPSADDVFSLSFEVLSKLKPARDLAYLRRSIPDLAQYRLAHHAIKAWARQRGIYGARFGYLGGIHISTLLVPVCKTLAFEVAGSEEGAAQAEDIVTTFFDHYAAFPWETSIVFDPFHHKAVAYRRTSIEPLCLLGWHPPSLNTAAAASKSTMRILKMELERAKALLTSPDGTWSRIIGSPNSTPTDLPPGAKDFLNAYETFVKLNIHYWGASLRGGAKLLGWIESRCVNIVVDIGIRVEGAVTQIWPQRFTGRSSSEERNPAEAYEGFYLIGVAWDEGLDGPHPRPGAKPAFNNLRTVVQQSERRVMSDDRYFDPSTSWFGASIVRGTQLGPVMLDERQWGRFIEEDESDEEDDEPDIAVPGTERQTADTTPGAHHQQHHDLPAAHGNIGHGSPKLRTAIDVLNRLRWDPDLDPDDYSIGYLDRFEGIQEKPVSAWKTEQTDEEFIPQHRIAYFRKKSTGDVVWDKARRIDLVFGHHLQAGTF